jgi:hypothetical protein
MHMEEFHDYTIHNGIGVRVRENRSCQVIRLVKGQWTAIGSEYCLPVEPSTLTWTATGIPATTLAVALRVYELDHPTSKLRSLITGKPAVVDNLVENKCVEHRRYVRPASISPLRRQLATAK